MLCGIAATPTADRYGKPVSFPIHNSKGRQRLYNLECDICWSFSRSYLSLPKNILTTVPTFEGVTAGLLRVQVFWDVNLGACHPVVFYNVKAREFLRPAQLYC